MITFLADLFSACFRIHTICKSDALGNLLSVFVSTKPGDLNETSGRRQQCLWGLKQEAIQSQNTVFLTQTERSVKNFDTREKYHLSLKLTLAKYLRIGCSCLSVLKQLCCCALALLETHYNTTYNLCSGLSSVVWSYLSLESAVVRKTAVFTWACSGSCLLFCCVRGKHFSEQSG